MTNPTAQAATSSFPQPPKLGTPPPLDQVAQSQAIPDPDMEVTAENVSRVETFLRQRGFFGSDQPDETDPYFELYTQVLVKRGHVAATGLGQPGKAPRAPTGPRLVGRAPSMLSIDTDLKLYTVEGSRCFRGRPSDPEKGVMPIPSFPYAAHALKATLHYSNQGNPYADLQLVFVDTYLSQNYEALVKIKQQCADRLQAKSDVVGHAIPWLDPIPQRPERPTVLSNEYSTGLRDILLLVDQCALREQTLYRERLYGQKSEFFARINKVTGAWRGIVQFIVDGYRGLLLKPEVAAIRRGSIERGWPPGTERFCIHHFKRPDFPEAVWSEARRPRSKS